MQQDRILEITHRPFKGDAVVYVMSRDQRVHDNHALLAAQSLALEQKVPLYVLFNLKRVPNRSKEHYDFMLQGLQETAGELESYAIPFVLLAGSSYTNIMNVLHDINAASVFFDFSPFATSRKLAKKVAHDFDGSTYVVDTHNVVPLWVVSDKQEYAAHTMRRKIHKALEKYMAAPAAVTKHPYAVTVVPKGISFTQAREFLADIPASGIAITAKPGERAAKDHLAQFIDENLEAYATKRNDIADDQQSGLSPYLHFGHISSLRIALEVIHRAKSRPLLFDEARMASSDGTPSKQSGMNALLEEMIVRKELSDNFCFYQPDYTSLTAAPDWAKQSLATHQSDNREFSYNREQWEDAQTHDDAWNAAQNQLRKTGKIHGYMRMYWAKKMLEWSASPEQALADCIYLNDKYSIDGGDPNGYVGILWSIAGLHDRPWTERSVFGTIRYMNAAGLKRKYDLKTYIDSWSKQSTLL